MIFSILTSFVDYDKYDSEITKSKFDYLLEQERK